MSSAMANPNLKNRCFRVLCKVSPTHGVLPKSYFLPEVSLTDIFPYTSGGFADICAVVLMEFLLSDLWGNHLHSSIFTSCEEILSTEEGRRTVLRCMFDMVSPSWSEFLCTPAKIVAAIRCLEELQCPNTAEAIILWAWTVCVVSTVDYDG